ncbi:MAG: transcriptional repressor [Clostridia bacterium]|nr:transcriptional repressor [Clostridia bacterium]
MNYSRQREQILEYVKSVKTHPTAETVYQKVREDNSNISLGTVYRNLDRLSRDGYLLRIKMANDKDRFDGDVSKHYHAVCTHCNQVFDIFTNYLKDTDDKVSKELNCKVLSHDVIFNIICPDCERGF